MVTDQGISGLIPARVCQQPEESEQREDALTMAFCHLSPNLRVVFCCFFFQHLDLQLGGNETKAVLNPGSARLKRKPSRRLIPRQIEKRFWRSQERPHI